MGKNEGGEERFKKEFVLPILRRASGLGYINFIIQLLKFKIF